MPAMFLREKGQTIGAAFEDFSNSAQRIGVYTAQDYIDIMQKLIEQWDIANMTHLTEEAERARDYLMKLPARMERVSQRIKIPQEAAKFSWVNEPVVG
jgi:acyl-[acyl-carrier-protein] desaturase